jgi:hypothetical protein
VWEVVAWGAGALRGGDTGVPGARGHAQGPPDALRARTRSVTAYHHLSPRFCGWVRRPVVGGCGRWWRGARGRSAVVTRGSRAPGVTPRAPRTRSAPVHAPSPPITTCHHVFVGGFAVQWWVGVGGGGVGRGGAPRW